MKATIAAAVALASTVAATSDWVNALSFACPSNTNNQCNNQQSTGFDWSTLGLGSFSQYGDFDFNGWSCASSFGSAKRDMLTGRTFQKKCITGTATSDTSKAPSFGCGSSKDVTAFSVTEVEISVEFDCELEFHYGMEDGSTCKQRSSCSSGGSVVKNSQCGGAKSVTVVYPSQTAGSGKGKDSCSIGVHSVGFDCSTASSTVHRTTAKETSKITTKATTTTSAEVTTTTSAEVTTTSTEATTTSTAEVEITSSSTAAATTSVIFANTTSTAETTSVAQTTQSTTAFTTSTVFTTFVSTIISCAATVTDCPAHSTALTTVTVALSTTICPVTETETSPATSVAAISSAAASSVIASTAAASTSVVVSSETASTTDIVSSAAASTSSVAGIETTASAAPSEVITTVVIETSTTLCPVTLTHTTGSSTHLETTVSTSTVLLTKTSTVCTKCEQTATSVAQISTSTTSTAQAAATTAACPDVLPQCLNTWLFSLGCSSNADVDCFCPDSTFITNVFDCVTAHGASSSEITTAQNYLQGICASYIPSNPAIVTAVTTLPPDTTGTAAGTITYSNIPVTTVQVFTTLVVPCTESTGISAGSVIPSSSTTTVISTQVAVPQVVFQTFTGTGTASISAALVQGTAPAAVSAQTTFATPAQTTFQTASSTANGTLTASPATFTGGSSVNTVAFGTLGAAVLFALMVI